MRENDDFGISEEAAQEYDRAIEIINEFSEFNVAFELIRWALEASAQVPSDGKFSNTTAALAAFTRAFHDVQAAISLCQVHCYPQALNLTRSIFEAAGIGRTMAKSPKIADQWLRGEWQPDRKARQFVRNVMYADAEPSDKEDAVDAYLSSYHLLSQWAHVTATSALAPYLKDSEAGYSVDLYPRFNEQALRFALKTILSQTVFLAYAIRNASARLEALGPQWLQDLDALSKEVVGSYTEELDVNYQELDKRHQNIVKNRRNRSEHKRSMKHDPDSIDNLLQDPDSKTV